MIRGLVNSTKCTEAQALVRREMMDREHRGQIVGALHRVVAVAAFAFLNFVPVQAVAGDDPFGPGLITDLSAGCRPCPHGDEVFFMLPVEDLHFCNSGVDIPSTGVFGSVEIGALFLTRGRAGGESTSKVFSQGDNRLLFNSADLSLDTSSGLDIAFLMPLGESLGLETRYFGITNWRASQTVADPLAVGVRFEGFGASLAADAERIDYASRLYSIELNVLPMVTEGVPVVLGFRSLQLHERFELWQLDPLTSGLTARTNNHLYGFQAGAEPYISGAGGALRVDGLIKAGIYGNHALQGVSSSVLGTSVDARRNAAAFVGEVGLVVVYRLNRFLALRGGYELLWLSNVALAPEQTRSTDLAAPSARVDMGSALMHGALASAEFVF